MKTRLPEVIGMPFSKNLAPVSIDMPLGEDVPAQLALFSSREVLGVLADKGLISAPDDFIERYRKAFPVVLATAAEVSALRVYESTAFGILAEAFHSPADAEAKAKTRSPGEKHEEVSLSAIPDVTVTSDEVERFVRDIRESLDRDVRFDSLEGAVSEENLARSKAYVLGEMERFLSNTTQIGLRSALAAVYGVSDTQHTLKKPLSLLARTSVLRSSVREMLDALVPGIDDSTKNELSDAIDLQDCSGMWLKYSVEQRLRRAFPEDEPNNLYDLEHIAFLPYVDLLFCDKRIAELTRQILRSRELPKNLREVSPPVTVPNDIVAISAAITSVSTGDIRSID